MVCSWIKEILGVAVDWLSAMVLKLPDSPWQMAAAPTQAGGILSHLAWFFPINEAVYMMTLFTAAALVWYTYRAGARLFKMIG